MTNLTGSGDEATARIAADARQADPGLPEVTAVRMAEVAAGLALDGDDAPDAPEVARLLLAAFPEIGATPANVVAVAAVRLRDGTAGDGAGG